MRRSLETGGAGQAWPSWSVPECPFAVEWPAAVMEEIRVAAMEALFSVPHGGAEIGGVLWGTRAGGCVRILAARPLECEHALGPTFTLSGKDHGRLALLLEDDCRDLRAQGWEPAGWYHSHTRSEILLSQRDVEIYNRYFPAPWHVALVVRPHGMQPMRAGFFFREADGSIRTDASYSEFVLQPADLAGVGQAAPQAVVAEPEAETEAGTPAIGPLPAPAGHFRRRLLWIAIALGMAAGLFAYKKDVFRKDWPRVFSASGSPSVSLMAFDVDGQLQIHWDWGAGPVRSAGSGTLEITDGAARAVVALDKRRLRSGTVSYRRSGARVDVRLALREPGGQVAEEFTSFLGPAGEAGPDAFAAALRRDLQEQAARTSQLERAVAELRLIVQRDQTPQRMDKPH
jgi:proteasome lid subunit RPN8/RPN11